MGVFTLKTDVCNMVRMWGMDLTSSLQSVRGEIEHAQQMFNAALATVAITTAVSVIEEQKNTPEGRINATSLLNRSDTTWPRIIKTILEKQSKGVAR